MQAVFARDCFNDELERLDIIASADGSSVFKVDLVLSRCNFVVRRFDFKTHFFELKYDVAAAVFAKVSRRKVEVSAFVVQFKGRLAFFVKLEQEDSGSGPRLKSEKPISSISFKMRFKLLRGSP